MLSMVVSETDWNECFTVTKLVIHVETTLFCQQVVCGQDHTLFLTDTGRVYSCGLAADGQTGEMFISNWCLRWCRRHWKAIFRKIGWLTWRQMFGLLIGFLKRKLSCLLPIAHTAIVYCNQTFMENHFILDGTVVVQVIQIVNIVTKFKFFMVCYRSRPLRLHRLADPSWRWHCRWKDRPNLHQGGHRFSRLWWETH